MAGMIGHDLALPVVDFIFFRNGGDHGVPDHLDAQRAGLKELARLHSEHGRATLAKLYQEVDSGFARLRTGFDQAVPDSLLPVSNKLAVTSAAELVKFIALPEPIDAQPQGCGCSFSCCCGCGVCCGCDAC